MCVFAQTLYTLSSEVTDEISLLCFFVCGLCCVKAMRVLQKIADIIDRRQILIRVSTLGWRMRPPNSQSIWLAVITLTMRTPILGVALASIVTTDLGHQNATAVLVKPHGISDVAKLEKRWRALTALPWCRNVDHLVFIELARAPPSRVALINKTMDGRAKFIDVSSEFVPEVARRTSNVSCPSNPTSNYFSFGYKVC